MDNRHRACRYCLVVISLVILHGCHENESPTIMSSLPPKFNYPASVGKSWLYRSQSGGGRNSYEGDGSWKTSTWSLRGIHTWLVHNVSVVGSDTLVSLSSAHRDTMRYYDTRWSPGGGTVVTRDSTYVLPDTTIQFTMELSPDTIAVNFEPTLSYVPRTEPSMSLIEHFSRTLAANSDTVKTTGVYSDYQAIYLSGVGLIYFSHAGGGNTYSFSETLNLVQLPD